MTVSMSAFYNGLLLGILALACYVLWRLIATTYAYATIWHKIPGPLPAKFSSYPLCRSLLAGRNPFDILSLHEKYGPVVQIAPNEVSCCSPESWQTIYNTKPPQPTFLKSDFYEPFSHGHPSIITERDPLKHREMHRYVAGAFSDRALKEQEGLVIGMIDQFMDRIGSLPDGAVELTEWFNLLTFDVAGELAFGKSFEGVTTGTMHPWVAVVMASLRESSLVDTFRRFPLFGILYIIFRPGWLRKLVKGASENATYAMQAIEERKRNNSDRKDFMTSMLSEEIRVKHQISDKDLAVQADHLVFAGSETTATALMVVVWHLHRDAQSKAKLLAELDHAFASSSEINSSSAARLPFLRAVCLEAMRIYPSVPIGLPRIVPEGGTVLHGHSIPGGAIISTHNLAAAHYSQNFKDPGTFNPDRWLSPSPGDKLDASQPFSLGSRACLGRPLAWMELYVTLAKLYLRYDIELLGNEGYDLLEDAEVYLFWKKPKLNARIRPRGRS